MNRRPRSGGTLYLAGPPELGHLDPVAADTPAAGVLSRLCTRGLFGYPAVANPDHWQAIAPVPDLATAIPSIYNAGVGASYTSYVVHLRPDGYWDTTPSRPVTAPDVVRGFKRLGNPVCRPAQLPCFTSTIRGMAEFCAGYATVGPHPAELAEYQRTHEIPGVFALDNETVVFELVRPALDFIDILALPCVAPAPVEYDQVLPDSVAFERVLCCTGPYRPVRWDGDRSVRLARNPVWRAESDPIRQRYVDLVEVTAGADAWADLRVAAPIGTGRGAEPGHRLGWALDPYLAANPHLPVTLRTAISTAINREALAELAAELRPGTAIRVANSIIPPGNTGHRADAAQHGQGDPDRARAMAGTDQLTVAAVHPDTEFARAVLASCVADLGKAGIELRPVALSGTEYRRAMAVPAGDWDLALGSWWPGWQHDNGRALLALCQGCPAAAELVERAAAEEDPATAAAAWPAVDRRLLADAAVLPLLHQTPILPVGHSARVHNAIALPTLGFAVDPTACWLADD